MTKIVRPPTFIVAIAYFFFRTIAWFVSTFRYKLQATGVENIPLEGPLILAGNHLSWFDPPVIGARFPRYIAYMAKKELFAIPFFGLLITCLGAFPVDREGSAKPAIKYALDLLKHGKVVGIFPEGGRNVEGDKQAQTGVALLAALSGAPVLPVCVVGTDRSKERPRPPFQVAFGTPMSLPKDRKATREDLAKFTGEIMAAIGALRERLNGNSQG